MRGGAGGHAPPSPQRLGVVGPVQPSPEGGAEDPPFRAPQAAPSGCVGGKGLRAGGAGVAASPAAGLSSGNQRGG